MGNRHLSTAGYFETTFLVFMLAAAYLCRNNPHLVYPEILYLFLVLLISNLAANYAFSGRKAHPAVTGFMLIWNTLIITAILHYSGGSHSYLWVLYLLPVSTASLLAGTRGAAGITLLAVAANTAFYGNPLKSWDYVAVFEMAVKFSVLVLAATATCYMVHEKKETEEEMEIKRMELDKLTAEMIEQRLRVLESDKMAQVGKMTSGIVHDLATPVTVILGSARLMEESERTEKTDIQRVINAALLCKNMLTNALDIARGQEYGLQPLDVREPVESALALYRPALAGGNITAHFNCAGRLPKIQGDFVHLERMFLNLFSNAKGAMPEGGEITIALKLSEDLLRRRIEVLFEDTGPGFPEHILKSGIKAFATTKRPGEGTGLGLFTCLQTAQKHNAGFAISNSAGGGASIKITFPIF